MIFSCAKLVIFDNLSIQAFRNEGSKRKGPFENAGKNTCRVQLLTCLKGLYPK